jgi:hypothetical protein
MNDPAAQAILDKVMGQITGYQNPYSVADFQTKFAFDIKLPQKVTDAMDGSDTWAMAVLPSKYIKAQSAWDINDGWIKPAKPINDIGDILSTWAEVNLMATERVMNSENVHESDLIDDSQNVYRCVDSRGSKNILLCDAVHTSEFVVASQRSRNLQYCAKVDDSGSLSECFSVNWSGECVKSMFLQDCKDMFECMFCSHIANKKFMIANMQYDEKEYFRIKQMVIAWLLTQ